MKKVEKVLLSIFVPMFFGLIAAVSACSISPATYTVNYYAEDKTTLLSATTVSEKDEAVFNFIPVKESDQYFDYIFDYWVDENGNDMTDALSSVRKDITVYPHFEKEQHTFKIDFYASDRTTLLVSFDIPKSNNLPDYSYLETNYSDDYYTYTFDCWRNSQGVDMTSQLAAPSCDMTVYASHTLTQHTCLVMFLDHEENLIEEVDCAVGTSVSREIPTRNPSAYVSYVNNCWILPDETDATESLSYVSKDLVVKASYYELSSSYTDRSYDKDDSLQFVVHYSLVLNKTDISKCYYAVSSSELHTTETLSILSEINGIPVTEINYGAFISTKLKHLVLPSSIQTVSYAAFKGCINLESVYIPTGVGHRITQVVPIAETIVFADCSDDLVIYCEDMAAQINFKENWNYKTSYIEQYTTSGTTVPEGFHTTKYGYTLEEYISEITA